MLRFLFPRLTSREPRGAALFRAAVSEARTPDWFADLGVPDSLDGRFSVLATVTALLLLRLEKGASKAQEAAVALTERFIESMEHEHRQLGYGDPTLGKIVRRLTGSLAARVDRFRWVVEQGGGWDDAGRASLKGLGDAGQDAGRAVGQRLKTLWERLGSAGDARIIEGEFE